MTRNAGTLCWVQHFHTGMCVCVSFFSTSRLKMEGKEFRIRVKNYFHLRTWRSCSDMTTDVTASVIHEQLFEWTNTLHTDKTKDVTNSMQPSPSREACSHSASEEIHCLSWNRKFITLFTRSHQCSLSWDRYIHSTPYHFLHFHSLISPMRATYNTALLILPDLMALIIFGEEYY